MILIIDDDIAVRTALLLLLQNEGYEVRSADEPAKAMALVKQQAPRLIILDLNFSIDTSGREGMQLLGEIKSLMIKFP
jgi:DNA-binding NtrC family response regulator